MAWPLAVVCVRIFSAETKSLRTASTKLKAATQRGKLAVRTAPHFNSIAPRRLLGYVKAYPSSAGYWIVQLEIGRTATGSAIRRRENLGVADDLGAANGVDIRSYEQALAAAIAWQPAEKSAERAFTVRDAVEQHRD